MQRTSCSTHTITLITHRTACSMQHPSCSAHHAAHITNRASSSAHQASPITQRSDPARERLWHKLTEVTGHCVKYRDVSNFILVVGRRRRQHRLCRRQGRWCSTCLLASRLAARAVTPRSSAPPTYRRPPTAPSRRGDQQPPHACHRHTGTRHSLEKDGRGRRERESVRGEQQDGQ
jgi:hypothetical protein